MRRAGAGSPRPYTCQPLAHERGLAETGGRRNEDDAWRVLQAYLQAIDQTRAVNDPGPWRRDVQLGGENGRRHDDIIEQPSQFRKASHLDA